MCKVSDKLKLCTCKTKNVEQLKHYWILKRPTESIYHIEGITILPADIGEAAHTYNQRTIMAQLNDANCFDFELTHQENDILELHFTCNVGLEKQKKHPLQGDYLGYAFNFKKGKWEEDIYDNFDVNFNEIQKGEINNPFSKF